ncbi:transglycosylase family protein [Dietzia sp.]|uniref:transglycosylase family protein n=1 Tax=Dietzia sp. TaxID=1871616 RepID=UPI003FA569A4
MSTINGRHRAATNSSHAKTFAKVALTGATVGLAGFLFSPGAANAAPISEWDSLAQCEAGGNWAIDTGNGFQGGLQFSPSTWSGYGGGEFAPTANQASREQQIIVGERVLAGQGWGAWPSCSAQLGLSGAPQERTMADFGQAAPAAPAADAGSADIAQEAPSAEKYVAQVVAEAAARGVQLPVDIQAEYEANKDLVDTHYLDNKDAVDNFMATYFGTN